MANAKGKEQKTYPYTSMMTPFEKLRSLPNVEHYLKPEISLEELDDYARRMTDNEAAQAMQDARQKLFGLIFKPDKTA